MSTLYEEGGGGTALRPAWSATAAPAAPAAPSCGFAHEPLPCCDTALASDRACGTTPGSDRPPSPFSPPGRPAATSGAEKCPRMSTRLAGGAALGAAPATGGRTTGSAIAPPVSCKSRGGTMLPERVGSRCCWGAGGGACPGACFGSTCRTASARPSWPTQEVLVGSAGAAAGCDAADGVRRPGADCSADRAAGSGRAGTAWLSLAYEGPDETLPWSPPGGRVARPGAISRGTATVRLASRRKFLSLLLVHCCICGATTGDL